MRNRTTALTAALALGSFALLGVGCESQSKTNHNAEHPSEHPRGGEHPKNAEHPSEHPKNNAEHPREHPSGSEHPGN